MQKIKIIDGLFVEKYDQNDYINNQKNIYDDLNKILNSFDYDKNLTFAKEYLDNLNGDIFLTNKQVEIFVLKLGKTAVSFALISNKNIDLLWTHFDFAKLGYATILLRVVAVEFWKNNVFELGSIFDEDNLICDNLFDSFSKVDGVEILENSSKNGQKTYKFGIKSLKIDEILENLKKFAI